MWKQISLLALLALSIITASCQGEPSQTLSFETIEQEENLQNPEGDYAYTEPTPALLIIAKPEEVDVPGLGVQFHPVLAERLRVLDYRRNFAVVILRGYLGATSPSYTIDILNVIQGGNEITLKTHLGEPEGDGWTRPAFSSPYHIILVHKEGGKWNRKIQFALEVDGQVVQEHTHFIP